MDILDFTFCALDLDISNNDIKVMKDEILNVNSDYWYSDNFRGCQILPLINGGGTIGAPPKGVQRDKGDMILTNAVKECYKTLEIIEHKIFPFMNMKTRVSVLKTKKDQGLNIHVDCGKHKLESVQHKFRIVLSGEIDKLFFLDSNNNKTYVPSNFNTYVLDGTHPHAIDPGNEQKLTICFGTPWIGEYNKNYGKLLEDSPYKIKVSKPKILDEWIK